MGGDGAGFGDLHRVFEALEEADRAPQVSAEEFVERWAPREPSFREQLEEIRPRRGPTFADVMEEFSRRALLSRRRLPSSQPVDDVDGPGTTGA